MWLNKRHKFHSYRTVGQWSCDYFDDTESLKGFGAANKEGLAELVWAFFEYWAWRHDYNNSVISIRTGGFLTKSQKEWTRRVGNERHLVCIEVSCGTRPHVFSVEPSINLLAFFMLVMHALYQCDYAQQMVPCTVLSLHFEGSHQPVAEQLWWWHHLQERCWCCSSHVNWGFRC